MLRKTFSTKTADTMHMTANEFADAFAGAAPGTPIVYAYGGLAYAVFAAGTDGSANLRALRDVVQRYCDEGRVALTQRRIADDVIAKTDKGPVHAYEYIATVTARCVGKSASTERLGGTA